MIGRTTLAIATLLASVSAAKFASKPPKTSNTRKARMISKLVDAAEPTENSRRLEQVEVDISGYEIKFEKCQFVKSYNDELAEEEESKTVLATQHFVVFRLCPSGSCESCSYGFGEYIVDMETYLEAATEYFVQDREDFCEMCNEICEADDDAVKALGLVDCDSCYDYCAAVDAMEDNGYVESYEFTECMQVYDADDENSQIFAGAICSNSGTAIKIGAFSDEDCYISKSGVDVEDYLENGLALNNEILQKVVASDSCVSCTKTEYEIPDMDADDAQQQEEEEEVEVTEMCEQLYEMSAKCEKYGLDNYWKDYEDYANQYVQEDLVCEFISSMNNGNYDEYGEIVLSGTKTTGSIGATGGQKFALTFFILSTIGLGAFAASLHSKLTSGGKADLSSQGGAMA